MTDSNDFIPMRNGIFLAPFHATDQDPTQALRRDVELIQEAIADALDTIVPVYFASDMADAVAKAAACAESDDTVLLAPACASTDQFANYAARGDAFRDAVEALR